MLRFPLSLLTIGALAQAIVSALMQRYEFESDWIAMAGKRNEKVMERTKEGWMKRAQEEAEGVFLDIQEAVRISDVRSFSSCGKVGADSVVQARLQDCLDWILV